MPAPLAVSIALPFVQPSVGSRNSPPPLSTVTLPQLCMLFQSTHEDRHGAEALAEPGERIVKSPLQRTLTAHIMSRWAKHEGALAHISLQRSPQQMDHFNKTVIHCYMQSGVTSEVDVVDVSASV